MVHMFKRHGLLLAVLFSSGANSTPVIGIGTGAVPPSLAAFNDGKGESAVVVVGVTLGSPAANAGVKSGDIVESVNGAAVTPQSIAATIAQRPVGSTSTLALVRAGQQFKIEVVSVDSASLKNPRSAEPDTLISGIAYSDDIRLSRVGQAAGTRCLLLNTRPGDLFQIVARQKSYDGAYYGISVKNSVTCSLPEKDNLIQTSSLRQQKVGSYYMKYGQFVAGGGPYKIIVFSNGIAGFKDVIIQANYLGKSTSAMAPTLADVEKRQSLQARAVAALAASDLPTASTSNAGGPSRPARTVFRDCDGICPEMVVIAAGRFMMGSPASEEGRHPDEGPRHQVTIGRAFAMGKYEVTAAEWDACVEDGGCPGAKQGRGRRPAAGITLQAALGYAEWLSQKTGQKYFIPSEAEWEYAARAGTETPWNTGDAIITDDANISNLFKQAVPVGGFPPNGFGLYDMHGNLWEWTLDCYEVGYFGTPADGKAYVTSNCPSRVVRSGDWTLPPAQVRSAQRLGGPITRNGPGIGFRVTRAL